MLAKLIGEDGSMYTAEANKIYTAMQTNLWLKDKGWYAEYKDLLGLKQVHPSAALWTVYHAIDEGAATAQQQYQLLRYTDNYLPHIPIKINGLKDEGYYLLATSNWQPYTWSINNVALGENLHAALAYWQGGENDNAFKLWKSTLVESMYASASPGGLQQLSFYDAVRGELYRDFADGIGMAARTLTEGLFGILPDALNDKLLIKPGFPSSWQFAKLSVPDISIDFKQQGNASVYNITQSYSKLLNITLQLKASKDKVVSVTVNGKLAKFKWDDNSFGQPGIILEIGKIKNAVIKIVWGGNAFGFANGPLQSTNTVLPDSINLGKAICLQVIDPTQCLSEYSISGNGLNYWPAVVGDFNFFFLRLKQGEAEWIAPYSFTEQEIRILEEQVLLLPEKNYEFKPVNLNPYFNAQVTQIFKNKYLTPRPQAPTLQLPWQGIGNWCYPLVNAVINDSGMRSKAGKENKIWFKKLPLQTPGSLDSNNIIFTSRWDNYPAAVTVPLSGKAWYAYLLVAGSTNHMQSQFTNAKITVTYTDGQEEEQPLINPFNWNPIEQEYLNDGYAFKPNRYGTYRLLLKSGEFVKEIKDFTSIKGFSNRVIDGGAATLLGLNLNNTKELKSLRIETLANDVVVGLMSVTLVLDN
jgi:hypothetical protein